jgi:hypothetical protein
VLTFFDLAAAAARKRDYRGCLYTNAATEFPGVVLEPVRAHREWVFATLRGLLHSAKVADAAAVAREIQMLYDGALIGSKIDRSTAPIARARALVADRIRAAVSGHTIG